MSEAGYTGRLAKGASIIGIAKFLTMGISLVSTIVLARLLLPEDFGLIAIAMTVLVVMSAVSELSLSQALVQLKTLDSDHYHTAFTLGVIRSLAIAVILFAIAGPIAAFYGDPRLENVVRVFALAYPIVGFQSPKLVDFTRRLDFRPEVIALLAERIVGFAVAVTVAVMFRSYWALVYSFIAAQAARVLATYLLAPYKPRLSLARRGDILSFSIWITLGNWVQTLNWRSDPLVLGYFLPIAYLGQYHVADRVTQMTTREITSPIGQVLFPAFSKMQDDGARLRLGYLKALATMMAVAFPIAAGLAIVAEPLVHVAFGEKWLPLIPYMQLLCVVALINPIEQIQPIAMAVGKTKSLFRRDVRALFIRAPLLIGGILVARANGFDMVIGAIIGRGAGVLINRLWNMQLIADITDVTVTDHIRTIARPALSTIVMTAGLVLFQNTDLNAGLPRIGQLLTLIPLGGVLYGLSTLACWILWKRPAGPEQLAMDMSRKLWISAQHKVTSR